MRWCFPLKNPSISDNFLNSRFIAERVGKQADPKKNRVNSLNNLTAKGEGQVRKKDHISTGSCSKGFGQQFVYSRKMTSYG
jgi:hypothetical protein